MAKVKSYTEEEMLDLFEDFLEQVEADGYSIIPSKSKFAKSIGEKARTIYKWCSEHPYADAKMKSMTADVISAGAMLKHYNPSASSLALKNWCGWEESPKKDKSLTSNDSKEEKQAEKLLDEYLKEQRSKASTKHTSATTTS